MYCGNCGKKLSENDRFCPYCGEDNKRFLDKEDFSETFGNETKEEKTKKENRLFKTATAVTIIGAITALFPIEIFVPMAAGLISLVALILSARLYVKGEKAYLLILVNVVLLVFEISFIFYFYILNKG